MPSSRTGGMPTPGEMEILQVLWREKAATIAETQAGLGRAIGYTTVQTRLNRLVEKGLVSRSSERPARYRAAVRRRQVTSNHLNLLLQRVCEGSVVPLVAHLVRDRALSTGEIAELKALIDQAERREAGAGGKATRPS